jgi:hypothetical protein
VLQECSEIIVFTARFDLQWLLPDSLLGIDCGILAKPLRALNNLPNFRLRNFKIPQFKKKVKETKQHF